MVLMPRWKASRTAHEAQYLIFACRNGAREMIDPDCY